MIQRLGLLLAGFFAWTIFFLIARALFLVYHQNLLHELPWKDILLIFTHGIRMDLSMAGYFSLLPGLLLGVLYFRTGIQLWPLWIGYHALMLFISSFIIVLDFELYRYWGFRLDATPLLYMSKEAMASGDTLRSILLVAYFLVIFVISVFLFSRMFKSKFFALRATSIISAPVLVVATALMIVPIRGSFDVAPMNTGFVYFHDTSVFANHAAVNVVWNFLYAVQKMNRLKYSDHYFGKEKTNEYYSELFLKPDSTSHLLKTTKPNIVIVVLESYTSGMISAVGGLPEITPNFNKLAKEGILFDNFYSAGDRTDKGVVAILNGYPSQPVTSIIKDAKKTQDIPYLNKVFKDHGYTTEFTYGVNVNFANFNSYLINGKFDHVTHSLDFPQELNTSKWGVHDEYVFAKFFDELQLAKPPFFKVIMTSSSHEPFTVPMETVIQGDDEKSRFLNSAYYTDKCFGEFIAKAKESAWWQNTLIVVTADHGHPYPNNPGVSNPDKFKIPMLWLGGALTKSDTVIHTVAGQPDIANTVLSQVNLYDPAFIFSHDILARNYDPFAIFVFNNGFGMIRPDRRFVFDNVANKPILEKGATAKDVEEGKAYIQKMYWDYNSR
ncbi:MAG: sulfatase-like hydrolase/transferase [Chryseolinea sp.]